MTRQSLHTAVEVWVREIIEMHQRSLDWAREAYRLEPCNYTAGQLAYCKVANSVAKQLLSMVPKGFRFPKLPDNWRELAGYRGQRRGPAHTEESVRSAISASTDMQSAISHLAKQFTRHKAG